MNKDLLTNNWRNCLTEIQKRISDTDYAQWFKHIEAGSFDGSTLLLEVPGEEWISYMKNNLKPAIKSVICNEFEGIRSLSYTYKKSGVNSGQKRADITNSNDASNYAINPFEEKKIKKVKIDPQLNFDYDFESFILGECNSLGKVTGMSIAQTPGSTAFNPFFICGESGMGKTHLAQAIGVEIKKNSPDTNVLYVSMNKFIDQYTMAAKKREVNNFVKFYQLVDVLILDDIHGLSGKPGTQRVMFDIFNHLHLTNKQLVFTCDRPPSELSDIENRLITRFKWGMTVILSKPDYKTKTMIIESKAKRLKLALTQSHVEYLAANIDGSVREIEGVMSSMVAHTTLLKREITIELIDEIIATVVGRKTPQTNYQKYSSSSNSSNTVTIDKIQDSVCSFYNIAKEDFFSKRKTQNVVIARQLAMYLAKEHTGLSLKEVGKAMGGKSHSTVIYACEVIQNRIATSKDFVADLERIKNMIF